MIIKSLYVNNFRNIKEATFDFSGNVNVFIGSNAQGKTNLLEAISLCIGRGFRGAKASALTPFDLPENERVFLRLSFFADAYPDKENVIEFEIKKGTVKASLNKIPMKSAAELYGVLKYVVFIPEHLTLIKGAPDLRRDYLDNVAAMQTKTHSKKLSNYNRALKQKNNLLFRMGAATDNYSALREQVSVWNEALAQEGINVTYGRLKYFDFLRGNAAELYSQLAGGGEELTMRYESTVFNTESIEKLNFDDKDELFKQYVRKLTNSLESELKNGYTVVGAHRDDICFEINGRSAKEFGSQGQVRSIALVLKLSEAEIIRRRNNETPIILLDEVLSELDASRRQFVINHIDNSQVFITSCNINDVAGIKNGRVWEVKEGAFTCIST